VRERNIYAVLLDGRVPLPKLRSPIDAGARLVLPLGSTRLLLERRRLLRVDSRMNGSFIVFVLSFYVLAATFLWDTFVAQFFPKNRIQIVPQTFPWIRQLRGWQ
jgi:hypothetical protein